MYTFFIKDITTIRCLHSKMYRNPYDTYSMSPGWVTKKRNKFDLNFLEKFACLQYPELHFITLN